MNLKTLVRISNIIAIISIVFLIYWVFTFILTEVFELRVFRENITQIFQMSILAILALMLGTLIINVMLNLTRIAERNDQDKTYILPKILKNPIWIFISIFPIIVGLLFAGDFFTSVRKKKLLIQSAESILQDNPKKSNRLMNYSFTKEWINEATSILEIFSKTDKYFPQVSLVVIDSIDNSIVFLKFERYYKNSRDTIWYKKKDFIFRTTEPERNYLNKIFNENSNEIRFSAYNGQYELYYPYNNKEKKIILYFSQYQRYGKIGS